MRKLQVFWQVHCVVLIKLTIEPSLRNNQMSLIYNSLLNCEVIQEILAAFMLNLQRGNLYTVYYFCTIQIISSLSTLDLDHFSTAIISWVTFNRVLMTKFWPWNNSVSSFSMVTISLPATSHAFLPMMLKANKTEPVPYDNNTSQMIKPSHHTFNVLYSTHNLSKCLIKISVWPVHFL